MGRSTLLIAVGIIAVTASVFAIWPAVADAPWEDEPVVVESTVRCEGALDFRVSIISAGEYSRGGGLRIGSDGVPGNPSGLRDYDTQLAKAENEIRRYCR